MLELHKNMFLLKISHCCCFNSFSLSTPPSEDHGNVPWVPFYSVSYIELFTSWDQTFLFLFFFWLQGYPIPLGSSFFLWSPFWVGSQCRSQTSHSQCSKVSVFLFLKVAQGRFCEQMVTPDVKFMLPHTWASVFCWAERDGWQAIAELWHALPFGEHSEKPGGGGYVSPCASAKLPELGEPK